MDAFSAFFTGMAVGMILGVVITAILIVIRNNEDRVPQGTTLFRNEDDNNV